MDNFKVLPADLPPEIASMIFDKMTVKEILNFRLVSSRCRQSVSGYQTKLKARVEKRIVNFRDVSDVGEFCRVASNEFPLTRFHFKFCADYERYSGVFREFGSRFGSSVLRVYVRTIHLCMGNEEKAFFDSLKSLRELVVGRILEWDDAFVLLRQTGRITLGDNLPENTFTNLRCFKFGKVNEPVHLLLLLQKLTDLEELHLGQFCYPTGNQRENQHVYHERGICDSIYTYLHQRETNSSGPLSVHFEISRMEIDLAPLYFVQKLGKAIWRTRTAINSIKASCLSTIVDALDHGDQSTQVVEFLANVKSISGFSSKIFSLPLSNVTDLEFEINWTQLCSLQPESILNEDSPLAQLRKLAFSCSVDRNSLSFSHQRFTCLQNIIHFLFGTDRSNVTEVKIYEEQKYHSVLIDPTLFTSKFAHMRCLDIDVPMYSSQEWILLWNGIAENCTSFEKLRVLIRCPVSNATFIGDHPHSSIFSRIRRLKQLDMEIRVPSGNQLGLPLTDCLIRDGFSNLVLQSLKLRFWGDTLTAFTINGFHELTVGNIRNFLCHFQLMYNKTNVEINEIQNMTKANCSKLVVD